MSKTALRLLGLLGQNQTAFATFMALPGMRTAQVVAHTGLDVSFEQSALLSYKSDSSFRLSL